MSKSEKRKEVIMLISKMDEPHLDALLTLLREPADSELNPSEADWLETERRQKLVKEGKVKMLPAREAVHSIASGLKKRRA